MTSYLEHVVIFRTYVVKLYCKIKGSKVFFKSYDYTSSFGIRLRTSDALSKFFTYWSGLV